MKISKIGTIFLMALLSYYGSVNASVITNSDLVGGSPALTLATGWTELDLSANGLFDGNVGNPGNGRVAYLNGSTLSDSNYISITADLMSTWEINSFQIGNDWGSGITHEVHSMSILFNGVGGLIQTISAINLDDDIINDIDDVFIGESISGVTSIEFRITGNQLGEHIELREFIVTGNVSSVPAPAATWLLGLGIIGLIGVKKKSAKLSSNYA